MSTKIYNKLVRDKIPEIIEADGKTCTTKILSDEHLIVPMSEHRTFKYLKKKLLKAIMLYADDKGRIKLLDIVSYFCEFYESRRQNGLVVEKKNSIFAKGGYTHKEAERNILSNPFKRFEDMNMLRHTKTLGIVEVDSTIWKKLSNEDKIEIERVCEDKLERYYSKMMKQCFKRVISIQEVQQLNIYTIMCAINKSIQDKDGTNEIFTYGYQHLLRYDY